MRKDVVKTAVSRFAALRHPPNVVVVILRDALDESLMEIAALLDATVDAVNAVQRAELDDLRALLADDVKLHQSLHPLRVGRAYVGLFFTLYAQIDGVSLAPAWLEGLEVIVVFEGRADPRQSYIMRLEWRDGQITFIRDYRYVPVATEGKPAADGAAQ